MIKVNITPRNDKGQANGYWEIYYPNSNLSFKGNYINGIINGYWENFYDNGEPASKGNYINGIETGYWKWNHNKNGDKPYVKEYIII